MSNNLAMSRKWQVVALLMLVVIDQLTKYEAASDDQVVMNYGGIFGLLPGVWWQIGLVFVLGWMIYEWIKASQWQVQWGLVLILAGGIGNVWDRLVFGGVRDFIYYPGLKVYGNVADIYLTMGVFWLGWVYLKNERRKDKKDEQ